MDSTSDPTSKNPSQNDSSTDLTHVAQEVYKKNAELAHKNKTLSILRKIDQIILSSVTDTKQIAQEVSDIVVEDADFRGFSLLLIDNEKKTLARISVSENDEIKKAEEILGKKFIGIETLLTQEDNVAIKSIKERKIQISHNIHDVYNPQLTQEEAIIIQNITGILTSIVCPLIIREEPIGVIIISLGIDEKDLSEYEMDLIERLSSTIGIAMDNALLYQRIQDANNKLKQLDKLKDEFVSLASHELRTPLTAIKSYLWMTLEGKGGALSEKQKYYLTRSYSSADRLSKLVNDMLNVSRIESGRIMLDKKEISLETLSQEVIAEILPRAQELGISLLLSPVNTLPMVSADPDKIKEVLINLIGNSLKFTPSGGTVTISFDKKEGFVETKVTDTGKGISEENIKKLFQKFGILEGTYAVSEQSQGTGLGLYITKSIIELHGGSIYAFSAGVQKGTSFSFTLPIAHSA